MLLLPRRIVGRELVSLLFTRVRSVGGDEMRDTAGVAVAVVESVGVEADEARFDRLWSDESADRCWLSTWVSDPTMSRLVSRLLSLSLSESAAELMLDDSWGGVVE